MVCEQSAGLLMGNACECVFHPRQRVEGLSYEVDLLAVRHVSSGLQREKRQRVVLGHYFGTGAAPDRNAQTLLGEK